jgi:hypothetical protein
LRTLECLDLLARATGAEDTGPALYAAILTPSVLGQSPIVLARLDATEVPIPLHGSWEGETFFLLQSSWVPLSAPAARIPAVESVPAAAGFVGSLVVPGRIGLAFRPDDPAAGEPRPGRFYVSWQRRLVDWQGTYNVGGWLYENQPMFAVSRGNKYSDVHNMNIAQGLVFDRVGLVANTWTSYAGGASLAYFAGNVRGVQQTSPEFKRVGVDPPIAYDPMDHPKTTFFPHFDGIFNFDQYDYDDVSYMRSHLSWALRQ